MSLSVGLAAGLLLAADVENPDYRHWARFAPGAWVKVRMVIHRPGGKFELVETTRLKDRSPKRVVVESVRVTKERGKVKESEPRTRTIPARKAVGDRVTSETREEITVGGETLRCRKLRMIRIAGGARVEVLLWVSEKVPGGVVRSIVRPPGASTSAVEITALEWEAK